MVFYLLGTLSIMLAIITLTGGDPIAHLMEGLFWVSLILALRFMFTRTFKSRTF